MPIGEGKYGAQLEDALAAVEAEEGVLIVLNGNKGNGFSVRMAELERLPLLLRLMADSIEDELKEMFNG